MKHIDELTGDVIDLAMRLHRDLGPGLLESVYETVLAGKLEAMGYAVARQVPVGIEFEGLVFDAAFRIDLLVDNRLLVEVKSVEKLTAAHGKQLLTYLRAYEAARWAAYQFCRCDAQGRAAAGRQQLRSLCVSASLREPY